MEITIASSYNFYGKCKFYNSTMQLVPIGDQLTLLHNIMDRTDKDIELCTIFLCSGAQLGDFFSRSILLRPHNMEANVSDN